MPRAHAVPLPTDVRVAAQYPGAFLADAFAIDLSAGDGADARQLAERALARPAPWVERLMALRDAVVAPFGLKTAKALRADRAGGRARIGIFRIYESSPDEVVLGEDDAHLDFRLSLRRSADQLVAVTVVHCHNLLGRSYIRLIAPFHRAVVRSALARAARPERPSRRG